MNHKKKNTQQNNSDLPTAIGVDCDHTLCLHDYRIPFEYYKCLDDKLNIPIVQLVKDLSKTYKIIIITGRENIKYSKEKYQFSSVLKYTEEWLKRNKIPYDEIFIKDEGDHRPDYIVKAEMYNNKIKNKYNILFMIDDRNQVVNQWRKMGLCCLDVAGNLF